MARTLITNRGEEVVDDLVLLNRHAVKEDFLCEKTGRETALRRPGKLKFIFCPGADLERADATLLDLCANQERKDHLANAPQGTDEWLTRINQGSPVRFQRRRIGASRATRW